MLEHAAGLSVEFYSVTLVGPVTPNCLLYMFLCFYIFIFLTCSVWGGVGLYLYIWLSIHTRCLPARYKDLVFFFSTLTDIVGWPDQTVHGLNVSSYCQV